MRIGIIGINYKLAGLTLREKLAKTCTHYFGASRVIHPLHEFVVLSTCNRTEIYFQSEDLASTHTYILGILRENVAEEFDQKLYSYFGQDCLLHLCRVTAGLDSAIVAETEIQGQVKAAYEAATKMTSLPTELHYLFQKSLKVGKQVRSQLTVQRGLPDLEHAILQVGQHLFTNSCTQKILFVGASEINHKILIFLKNKKLSDLTLCNRTHSKACEIAEKQNCEVLPWEDLKSCWHQYDWVILGTKAPEPIITRHSLPDFSSGPKLLIDLSVPRNVDVKLAKDPRITLLNIDQIDRMLSFRRKQIQYFLTTAESEIEAAAKRHTELFQERHRQRMRWLAAV